MVIFCLGLGSPAPQTAYRPQISSNPYVIAHMLPALGGSSHPSQVGSVRGLSLPGFKARVFCLSFQELRCAVPVGTPLCAVLKTLGSPQCTVFLYLFADCPSCPDGLLMASHLCPSPSLGPGTTSSLELTGRQGHRDLSLHFS